MTVGELLEQLQKVLAENSSVSLDTKVITEGCDCWADAKAVDVGDDYVIGGRVQRVVQIRRVI